MKYKAVLFDLDGTLLPMDQDLFVKTYLKLLAAALAPSGYEPQQFIATIWAGIKAMVKNDGTRTNETAFWEVFTSVYGEESLSHHPIFEEFYRTTFQSVQAVCSYDPRSAEIVKRLKAKGVRVVLATNPLFPAIATESRMRWAGLQPTDFELFTTYENIGFCKPNLAYYKDILDRIGCAAEECLMVGNDVGDDTIAKALGMDVFLLTDCLINQEGQDITAYPHGDFEALTTFLRLS